MQVLLFPWWTSMDVSSIGQINTIADQYPLLMEPENHNDCEHIINITSNDDDSLSDSSVDGRLPDANSNQGEESVTSSSIGGPTPPSSSSFQQRLNSRNTSSSRRGGDGNSRRTRSPLNSGIWISVELVVTVGQIITAIVVLALAKDEQPQAPLFAWVIGYASGCVATLPIIYWRFRTYCRRTDQDSSQHGSSSQGSNPQESMPYTTVSLVQSPDEENNTGMGALSRNNQVGENLSTRLDGLVDHFKMALDCFFAVWFVVGNVWIFGGHSSSSDAPKLYRLCIVFLTFSCIGYAMPFILCATICCCLPCLISVLGFRGNFSQTRGATIEAINALPVYRFTSKSVNDQDSSGEGEGGLLSGSEEKRLISGEDAACCICLARYVDNDELRELGCRHVFHVECVDKWLKINASCPLCKFGVGESSSG